MEDKKIKDLGDIARLVENHPHLWTKLDEELQQSIQKPLNT
jgi:hypothetical protein